MNLYELCAKEREDKSYEIILKTAYMLLFHKRLFREGVKNKHGSAFRSVKLYQINAMKNHLQFLKRIYYKDKHITED